MDDMSAEVILDLLRQDLADLRDRQKGKQLAGNLSDAELSLQLFEEELNHSETVMNDRRLAISINDALQEDEDVLINVAREEDQALEDRQLALELAGRAQTPAHDHTDFVIGEFAQPSPGGCMTVIGEGSSSSRRQGNSVPGDRRFECVACLGMEFGFDTIQVPCAHHYCVKCIIRVFENSLTNDSLFPPTCCRETIALSSVKALLGPSLVRQFEEKETELRDPSRTYCADRNCSAYISPVSVEKYVGNCRYCKKQTCIRCKKFAHPANCAKDPETEKVLETAKEKRWQRCYKCYTMVELESGCYHIR